MRSCSRSAAGVWATVRAGFATGVVDGEDIWNRLISPHPPSSSEVHSSRGAAKSRRPFLPRHRKRRLAICLCPAGLIVAGHFNLPHLKRLDPRPAARLDEAADANSLVFEGLERNSRGLEGRSYAP